MLTLRSIRAVPFEVPLRHPFATARDQLSRQVTTPIQVTVECSDGTSAAGEAVPVRYVTGETTESVIAAIDRIASLLVGSALGSPFDWSRALMDVAPEDPAARAGVEMALLDLVANRAGQSLWRLFGARASRIETDLTIPVGADAAERAREAVASGFRRFKVKVSGDIDADLDRIIAVHLAAPGCAVRIDANQSLTPNDALQLLDDLLCRGVQVELLEQPTPRGDLEALDRVARQSPVPVFADEAVLTPAEARRLVSETCVHGINVKLMKSGFGPALEIVEIARGARRDLMIGCMLETRRGIGAALAFACGTDAFRYADLDSHLLLAEEGANSFFREEGPYLCPLG